MSEELRDLRAKISPVTWAWLCAEAEVRGREVSAVVRDILTEWADTKGAAALAAGHFELRAAEGRPSVGAPLRESDIEAAAREALAAAGYRVSTQIKTPFGIADLVIDGGQRWVVEFKTEIRSWRELHSAIGQAFGYGDALGADRRVVCAAQIDSRFRFEAFGVHVVTPDELVALVNRVEKGIRT